MKQMMRPTKGYQKNIAVEKMKEMGIEIPTEDDIKKLRIIAIVVSVVWALVSFYAVMQLQWWGALGSIVALILIAVIILSKFTKIQKKMIYACKMMGVPKETYLSKIEKRQQAKFALLWDSIEVPETEFNTIKKGRPNGVNQSKQNKKKKKRKK